MFSAVFPNTWRPFIRKLRIAREKSASELIDDDEFPTDIEKWYLLQI